MKIIFQRHRFRRLAASIIACVAIEVLAAVPPAHAQDVLVSYLLSNQVHRYSSSGQDLGFFASSSPGLDHPIGLAVNSAGTVFVANQGHPSNLYRGMGDPGTPAFIQEYSSSGQFLGPFANGAFKTNGGIGPIAFNSKGDLFTVTGSDNVREFSAAGQDLGNFATGLTNGVDLAFGSQGNLYVADHDTASVQIFSSTGQNVGEITAGLHSPGSLAFDSQGDLFVTDFRVDPLESFGHAYIEKFSPTGQDLGTFVRREDRSGSFTQLAFQPNGDLLVGEVLGSDVLKYSSTGAYLGVFSSGLNGDLASGIILAPDANPVPEESTVISFGLLLCLGLGSMMFATRKKLAKCKLKSIFN